MRRTSLVSTLFAALLARPPSLRAHTWCAGEILRGSWTAGSFRLEPLVCEGGYRPRAIEVVYSRGTTAAICERADVEVVGELADGRLVATSVTAVRLGRYDGDCYLTACLPAMLRPERCLWR